MILRFIFNGIGRDFRAFAIIRSLKNISDGLDFKNLSLRSLVRAYLIKYIHR